MDKISYTGIFQDAVEVACLSAEEALGRALSRDVVVRMYDARTNGLDVSPEEFIDRVYIDDQVFYRLIDLMVVAVIDSRPVLFARVSDHPPTKLSECWNGEKGPFKQIKAESIHYS